MKAESQYGGQRGHVLTMVRKELERLGFSDAEIDGGGLRVTTTFTRKAMNAAQGDEEFEAPVESNLDPRKLAQLAGIRRRRAAGQHVEHRLGCGQRVHGFRASGIGTSVIHMTPRGASAAGIFISGPAEVQLKFSWLPLTPGSCSRIPS